VRVLAATNQNLEQLIAAGRFRSDLYYRLNVVAVHVPPLRERREDLPELAHYFLYRHARQAGRDVRGFAPEVLNLFQSYDWPGNVRQLQNTVRSALYKSAGGIVRLTDLPELGPSQVPTPSAPAGAGALGAPAAFDLGPTVAAMLQDGQKGVYGRVIELVERELIARALQQTRGHQAQASDLLGISRATLRNKLRELGIAIDKVISGTAPDPDASEE
ncbi:MAG: sigma-54-dependent Fis family transcriptional regulator, partial [Planctomycetes bacterium]|nr:sigma-54-dependent Fis family transcriptional regulator [Planctomycetota bacterium]